MTTFPSLLLKQAQRIPNEPAIRSKGYGIWRVTTWKEAEEKTARLAGALQHLGVSKGDRVGVFWPNSTEAYLAYLAAQSLGAIPVPIGSNTYGEELKDLLQSVEVSYALAEGQQQVDALLECGQTCVRQILYADNRGMGEYRQSGLHLLSKLLDEAASLDLATLADGIQEQDTAMIVSSSGTHKTERAIELSHASLIRTAQSLAERGSIRDRDELMAYLPLSVVSDVLFSFALCLTSGCRLNCPESEDTVLQNMQEIGPTVLYAPSYVYKYIFANASNRIESATDFDAAVYKFSLRSVMKVARHRRDGASYNMVDRLRFWFARATTFGPFCNVYGLSKLRLAISGGEPIPPDVFQFFRAIGIDLRETYGLAEGCGCVTIQDREDYNSDSVGRPLGDTEIRIEEGEIWFRGPGCMTGVYGQPELSEEYLKDGWVRTHDIGHLDSEGRLHVEGQVSRQQALGDGTTSMPNLSESELCSSEHVKFAYVHGDEEHDHLVAVMAINGVITRTWADRRSLRYVGYSDLATHPEVRELMREQVVRANERLAGSPNFPAAGIRRFALMNREFMASAGEVTATRKLRSYVVRQKYQGLIDALFTHQTEYTLTDSVDGREYVVPLENV